MLRAEASAAFTGIAPIPIKHEVAKFTHEKTGSEQGGAHESEPFVSCILPYNEDDPWADRVQV